MPFRNSPNHSIGTDRVAWILPNGVDAEQFKPLPRNNAFAESLNLINNGRVKESRRVIGFAGELRGKKDYVRRPLLRDGVLNALVEAMACEKAVIGTAVGGIVDAIRDSENGKLVPTNNADTLGGSVTGDCLRKEFGMGSRQTILNEFSLQSELEGNLVVYNRLGRKV